MALYAYQAFTREGKKSSGVMDASSMQEVRDRLVKSGLLVTRITKAEEARTFSLESWIKSLFSPRVTAKDVIFFTKQLSVLLKAGVPLLQALELLIEQTEKSIRAIIIALKDGIKEGKSLADGLLQYPKIFDTTYVQLVRAGEASGKLELILDRLVAYLERAQSLRKKISEAMTLPMIQLVVVVIVVVVLLTVVVPQMAGVFATQGVTLPLSTRILLGLSDGVRAHSIALLVGLVLCIGSFVWWRSTKSGAYAWDQFTLRLPVVGYFVRTHAVVKFCSTLGMLIESGVNLAESLSIVCTIINNRVLIATLQTARDKIIKQGKITVYLKETGIFPPLALYLMKTGEESGQLGEMLTTVAQTYDAEMLESTDTITETLNPIMVIVMGLVVGFVVMAIGTPIMQLGDVAGASMKSIKVS